MTIQLETMQPEDITESVELIAVSMNLVEAKFAKKTMDYHFRCMDNSIDDGRDYYIYRKDDRIIGLVGLHNYIWGPGENVWLTWFCVHPDCQNTGIGTGLIEMAENLAKKRGYRKFFIETYDSDDFEKARKFYSARGYENTGRIENYLPSRSAMEVFCKLL